MTKPPPEATLHFTLADLAISPLNVRFNEADANAVEALSASIVEQGLLEQLLIHPALEGAKWAKRTKACSRFQTAHTNSTSGSPTANTAARR